MQAFLQKQYPVLIKAGIITVGLALLLKKAGLIIVDPSLVAKPVFVVINTIAFLCCWGLISFLINKFSTYKVLGVISLLALGVVAELYIPVANNPFTIPLLILFWLGIAYLILPAFFKKYRMLILSAYVLVILYYYFFFFTIAPNIEGNSRTSFANVLFIPIPIFVSLWIYEQWRWLKTLRADKVKAELALLKSQINPHFFFNTLNNLYGLVVEKSDDAPEVVIKLSDMMRYTIYEGKEDSVLLKDEISYLENYIELHKIRYQKKVDIHFTHDVEPDLMVAPLLFIILLENAFKHGVEKMNEHAFIHLQMKSQGKKLFFTIENNMDVPTSNSSKGIGLENLKQRLEYSYPKRHELRIEEKESTYKVQLTIKLT